ERFNEEVVIFNSKQSDRLNLLSWQKVKNGEVKIAVGTRMAVFLPFNNLGLIIVDSENNPSYKEEQRPYYHARVVSFMHADLTKAELILSDISPSLESMYLVKQKKIDYLLLKKDYFPSIVLIDIKKQSPLVIKKIGLTYPFQEILKESLRNKKRVLIFLNRKGFSTFIYCPRCRKILKCPRCDVNLVYYFKEKKLTCHYCNYKCLPPKICPDCNSSYIRYTGIGIEKLESKLSWLYPEAKISKLEKNQNFLSIDLDFIISTDIIFRKTLPDIDTIGVVSLDNVLNRIDFRASERAFYTLLKLLVLNPNRIILQTELPGHYCFKALLEKDISLFYEAELNLRKELQLPPFRKLVLIKLRGKQRQRVKDKTKVLFKKLINTDRDKSIKVISYFANSPEKLRDNYIWQIMLSSKSTQKLIRFLKKVLKKFKPSGIIINVEID
ncbi:MAG: primosomal protein N', partial [Candidatus Omnitrophica bacterium]|nr:primosomal protein N' [Candidatus Omnitrophota bacterium]